MSCGRWWIVYVLEAWYGSSLGGKIVNLIMLNDLHFIDMPLTYLPCDVLS